MNSQCIKISNLECRYKSNDNCLHYECPIESITYNCSKDERVILPMIPSKEVIIESRN